MRLPLMLSMLALASAGCMGSAGELHHVEPDPDGPGGDGDGAGGGSGGITPLSDEDVFNRLSVTCVGCHGEDANRPYFVSQTAFRTLLMSDRKWIEPGKPDQSALIPLLRGLGKGAYKQMP